MAKICSNTLITLLALIMLMTSIMGSSQHIPDDVVYTEVKKTVVNGTTGILRCRFKGLPIEVVWSQISDTATSTSIIIWSYDKKSGPRYEDGSCDIDGNFSLVIKNVRKTDAGRYICRVINYKGNLIYNHTDVTITNSAVRTEQSVAVQKGEVGVLPCQVFIRPKRVSWVRGANDILVSMDLSRRVVERSGPAYEEGLFNITKDHSLLINDVKIHHEDSYFCEVTDFDTGHLFRNVTGLNVFAPPIKPFPAIEGCSTTEYGDMCILNADSSVNLTCHANEYYPDVGIYFEHGSKEVAALHTQTWNNTDGTKNKSVTIVGDISHELYRCIAFDIPGVVGNRSTSVRLIQRNGSPNLVALIVPFVLIAIGVLVWIFLRRRGMCHSFSKGERPTYQEDPVTYVELWNLVEYAFKHKENNLLDDAIAVLCNDGYTIPIESRNEEYYYNELCRWKERCNESMQMTTLYETLCENGLKKSLANLKDFRRTVSTDISQFDLKQILWTIGGQDEITAFLVSLKIDRPERPGEAKPSFTIFRQQALTKLITWATGKRKINPVIILSSTLERLNHESANNFFRSFADSEYRDYARKLSINHVAMLAAIITSSNKTNIRPSKTLEENWDTLFNFKKMLRDWWEEQEGSNYERRCKLGATLRAVEHKRSVDTKPTADEQWPTDEELKLIANYIDQKSATRVHERLGMSDLLESVDEQKRFEALCAWRQSNKGEWTQMHDELVSALNDTNIAGLLSPLRNDAFHKVEVVDIAFDLLMTDILPVARLLGVCEAKLSSYRPVFEPSHLNKGTIGLVSTLLDKSNQREDLWRKLREGGFPSTIQRKVIAYKISYGELSAISKAVMRSETRSEENTNTTQEGSQPNEGDTLLGREEMLPKDTTIVPMELHVGKAQESGQHFNKIKKMLNLTDEEVSAGSLATCPLEVFTLFKIWKEKPRHSAFNYRAAVIKCLQDFGKSDIAISLIEGRYKADEKSLSFIKHMVKKEITDSRLKSLAEALNLQKDFPGAQRSVDATSEIICERLMVLKHAPGVCIQRVKERDHGFLDLARELLIINQQ